MDYVIGNTTALDARSSFNIKETAALIAGINPSLIDHTEAGEFVLKRDWDCPCQQKNPVRTMSFGNEDSVLPDEQQRRSYAEANASFVEWMDTLYDAIEIGHLEPAVKADKPNPKEPAFRNMPRYAQIDALDPLRTKITREEIVRWLTDKEITTGYFFPNKPQKAMMEVPGYLDPNHECYSWRLHLAIRAWEHAASKGLPTAVRPAIAKFLEQELKNKERIGNLIDAICLVGNWNEVGGAPKTPSK